MSSPDSAPRGLSFFHFLFPALLALAMLTGLAWVTSAAAAVDPMAPAVPGARYGALPDKAPPVGRTLLLPDRSAAAGPTAGTSAKARGGMAIPRTPRVSDVTCVKQCVSARKATPGAVVRITGGYLNGVRKVVFQGKKKRIRVAWRARRSAAVRVVVPKHAVNGRVFVIDSFGESSNRSPREIAVVPVGRIPVEAFPVQGAVNFGGRGSRFGVGRPGHTHQGQDVAASCGTRLVSARKGRVTYNKWHSGAGHYVVIKNTGSNTSFVYMHMIRRSPLKVGSRVNAGTPIGRVGSTGRSSGCHLHFEYWVGPWQMGGKPLDPKRYLKSLLKQRNLRKKKAGNRKRAIVRKRALNKKRSLKKKRALNRRK